MDGKREPVLFTKGHQVSRVILGKVVRLDKQRIVTQLGGMVVPGMMAEFPAAVILFVQDATKPLGLFVGSVPQALEFIAPQLRRPGNAVFFKLLPISPKPFRPFHATIPFQP